MILLAIVSLLGSAYLMYCSIVYGYFLIYLSLMVLVVGTILTFVKFTGYEIVSSWGGIVMDVMPASFPMAVTFFLGYLVFGMLAANVAAENWMKFFCGVPVANYKDPGGFLGFCYSLSNVWGAIMVIVAAIVWITPTLIFCLDTNIKKHFRYIIGGMAIVSLCMFLGRYGFTIVNIRLSNVDSDEFAKVAEVKNDEVHDFLEKTLKEVNIDFISAECLGCGGHRTYAKSGVDIYGYYMVDASYTDVDPETNEERTTEFNFITGVQIADDCKKNLRGEYTFYENSEMGYTGKRGITHTEIYLSEIDTVLPLIWVEDDLEIKPNYEKKANYPYVDYTEVNPEFYQKVTIKN